MCILISLVFVLSACRKKEPAKAEIHTITQEFVAAAQQAVGRTTEIAIRPEQTRVSQGQLAPADHIYLTLEDSAKLDSLETAFDRVARRHHLARQSRRSRSGMVRLEYGAGEYATHAIHIVVPLKPAGGQQRIPGKPLLAIIVDDLGYDPAAAEAVLAMPFPLTVSVLPDLPHSAEIAEEARRRGYQVLLHLPMQAEKDVRPETNELRAGMTEPEVARQIAAMLQSVPGAVGVNNHQGSLVTADTQLMDEMMPVLRQRGLFFIDSRTTAATVAYEAAQRAGVPAAYRNVFLDDSLNPESIRHELERAELLARKRGWSIAIGHPHMATLDILREDLPRLQSHGLQLVFASELAK